MKSVITIVVMVALTLVSSVQAEYMNVGSGSSKANVIVEFSDGAIYAFTVSFDDPNTTGLDLFDIIEAGSTLTTDRIDYGWGWMVDGISYKGHSNSGFGGGENWWHYWNNDSPNDPNWFMPWDYGTAGRIVANGFSDAHIYGDANAPRLPGDVNENLTVDINDLVVMKNNWNVSGGKTWADGDFNGDGAVAINDLVMIKGNWNFGVSVLPTPIPEPATAVLVGVGLAIVLKNRRRK